MKTDSGIVDEPASESSAAKKKSKSKKQREKKQAAAAAAAQQQEAPKSPEAPQGKEKIVIDLTPTVVPQATPAPAAAPKPKDKKKKTKSTAAGEQKQESNEKVQYETWIGFSLVFGFSITHFFFSPPLFDFFPVAQISHFVQFFFRFF